MATQQQHHESIIVAKQHLMAKLKCDEKTAEDAVVKGFRKIAQIAGEKVPGNFSLKDLNDMLVSGKYAEIEKKARANADRIMAQHDAVKKQGSFERVKRNKFI
jgi:hypothetical protein